VETTDEFNREFVGMRLPFDELTEELSVVLTFAFVRALVVVGILDCCDNPT
jgi:hypothetical protein